MSRIRETGKSVKVQPPDEAHSGTGRRLPAWRRIEVWRERQALKRALADLASDDPALDEAIFLQDPAHRGRYFTPDETAPADEPGEVGEDADWDDVSS